ncbi:hypothetical protein PLEOSDRAFT_167354 [Pleurotus ostreatus PC15]|uniref:Uncharacterized protein n=1 Tax=Pleurotus ostreatus (strain PC15) TaxID=1137138 RepID=A0A067NMV5_PLEO1|nr:hypothetical protein PLEOSDRAFT_167354 [Pleurotus ostreatus PC15]
MKVDGMRLQHCSRVTDQMNNITSENSPTTPKQHVASLLSRSTHSKFGFSDSLRPTGAHNSECMAPLPSPMDDVDPITLKYQQSIPLVLLPASSHLAAFHVARLRPLANPSIQLASLQDSDSPFCLKCGSLYTHAGNTRILRVRHKISTSKRERGLQEQQEQHNGRVQVKGKDNYKDNVGNKDSVECGDSAAGEVFATERVPRVLQRSCDACGWVLRVPIPPQQQDKATSLPKKLKVPTTELPVSSLPSPIHSDSATSASLSKASMRSSIRPKEAPAPTAMLAQTSASTSRSKSRSKKSTLQDMLTRNRKQEANRTQPSESNNLAAFLTGLQ